MAHYSKRYAGGFVDLPTQTTAIDSTFLNAVESALTTLYGSDPTSNQVMAWNGTTFAPKLLDTSNISATAAITKSQLASLGIVDADVAVGAAIAASKIANGINASQLTNYPTDGTKALFGDGTWKVPTQGSTWYRKNTAKVVSSTTIETDLLNGEITVGAGVLTSTGVMRLTAWGDGVWTAGAAQATPRFKVVAGAGSTTLLDTGAIASMFGSGTVRGIWRIVVDWVNLGSSASQWVTIRGEISKLGTDSVAGSLGSSNFTTGQGLVVVDRTASVYTRSFFLGGNSGTIDCTASVPVKLTVINGSATSTDVTLKGAVAEVF